MKPINLDNEPKIETGFKVPENYFENFSERLLTKLPEKEVKVISIFEKQKNWLFAVAAILVLAISIPVLLNYSNKYNQIGSLTLENYITNNSNINDNDLAELLTQNDIENIKIDLKIEEKTLENELLENENLEEFLIN